MIRKTNAHVGEAECDREAERDQGKDTQRFFEHANLLPMLENRQTT
jgi:hypothetical protein